ncbi:glycosyltransferase family 2 protein [Fusicatenibacter sp.]
MPKISVIVPVYKVEKFINKCVDSILAQSFTDFELWLVDDGSPDNCGVICDEYAQKDNRVKVIHKENGGLSDARNTALDVMQGEYVFFVDSDDWIAKDTFESMYAAVKRTGAKVATGNMISVNEDGKERELYSPTQEEKILKGEEMLTTLLRPNACNRLYKAEIFQDLRFPVGRLYEDVFVYHKILTQIDSMVLTGKNTYYYLVRDGSIMNSEYNIKFTDIVDAVYERAKWLDSIGQKNLADETRLFVYSQVAVAYAHLDKRNCEHFERLNQIKLLYDECYEKMIKAKQIGWKQKIRLFVLKNSPSLHTALWGRKMAINLGGQ